MKWFGYQEDEYEVLDALDTEDVWFLQSNKSL